jgi:CBS domain-containing protein
MSFARAQSEQQLVMLPPNASAFDAAVLMGERRVGAVIVVSDRHKPLGIVTDRDLAVRVIAKRLDPEATRLEDVMSRDLVTARDESQDVATLMALKGVRRVPLVAEDGRLTGIVTLDDLLAVHAHRLGCLSQALSHERS